MQHTPTDDEEVQSEFIDFDGDGFDGLAAHTFTPIPTDHYAAQGVTLLGLDARSVNGQPWSHSPPIGAWQTGFSAPANPYSFVFDQPMASFGMFGNDVEGPVGVMVHLDGGGTESFTVPAQGGANITTFFGFAAADNVITRIDFNSGDYHIIDDIQFGRIDTVDPVISGAVNRMVPTASPDGAVVDYGVTATDDEDPSPVVACDPMNNSLLPLGVTPVSCTATDATGNQAQASFTVTVELVVGEETFDEVAADIEALGLPNGAENSFVKALEGADKNLANGDNVGACDKLTSLVAKIDAQDGKKLTTEEAAELRDSVQAIVAATCAFPLQGTWEGPFYNFDKNRNPTNWSFTAVFVGVTGDPIGQKIADVVYSFNGTSYCSMTWTLTSVAGDVYSATEVQSSGFACISPNYITLTYFPGEPRIEMEDPWSIGDLYPVP